LEAGELNKKLKISVAFLVLIGFVSGYFLWQIDRHEKALLGKVWLIEVPSDVWKKYLDDKESYPKVLESYKSNNPEIVKLVEEYRIASRRQAKTELEKLLLATPIDGADFSLSFEGQMQFKRDHPREYQTWNAIVYDLKSRIYPPPTPQNPPKPVIEQSIKSYYRCMLLIDGILMLSLIVFLMTYKEKGIKEASQ
jgi:hypothetical protein